MRQAIITKWHGPTNTKGSRVRATAAAGAVTQHWDWALNPEANHAQAAIALATKYGWSGWWAAGGMPAEAGNCYVWVAAIEDEPTIYGTEGVDWFLVPDQHAHGRA